MRFSETQKYAILLIAAGSSSRLGRAKQLLPYRATFLLRYMIEQCLEARVGEVHVVLGARKKEIAPKIEDLPINLCYNPDWAEGMSTSIAFGINKLLDKGYKGVFVVLGDQPFFTADLLQKILTKQEATKAPIIVSKYQKGLGSPTFFEASLFSELAQIRGDIGAKPVVKRYFEQLEFIDFPKGNIDIDTEEDLKWLE